MKVFISHSSDDKRFVRTLKADLNENGINTWFDEDELNFGDSLIKKLETSIEDTSYFIIVLSESSVNSPWVQLELKKVLQKIDAKKLQRKIIPIKYKKCEIPEALSHMLFADVSEIVRIVDGDKLIFKDENYHKFIAKLCKSLTSEETKLSKADKQLLTKPNQFDDTSVNVSDKKYLNLHIKGFAGNEQRERYSNIVEKTLTQAKAKSLKILINRPVILPRIFSEIFPNIKIGDKIIIKNKANEQKTGLFAGFRKEDDQVLILPVSIRNYLNIAKSENAYDVVVSISNKEIMVL